MLEWIPKTSVLFHICKQNTYFLYKEQHFLSLSHCFSWQSSYFIKSAETFSNSMFCIMMFSSMSKKKQSFPWDYLMNLKTSNSCSGDEKQVKINLVKITCIWYWCSKSESSANNYIALLKYSAQQNSCSVPDLWG